MQDPVNAMERNLHQDLLRAEGKVEVAMPKRFTAAEEALDMSTSAAAVIASQKEARIQKELMKHTVPQPKLNAGPVESSEDIHSRDKKIREEVLSSIDPTLH